MRHEPRLEALGWADYLGATDTLVPLRVMGRYPVRVQELLEDATLAFQDALIATGYENPCDYIGSYMKRPIGGTDIWSSHSYGVAIDFDYGGDTDGDGDPTIDKNPHLHRRLVEADFGVNCQLTRANVEAIEAIRNTDGAMMWRWLGWSIGDTMHFQINVPPNATTVDWTTVPGHEPIEPDPDPEDTMPDLDTFVAYIRKTDIAKMGDDKIITADETLYFTGDEMWIDDNTKRDPEHPDWANLYNAWRVRSPIWAV